MFEETHWSVIMGAAHTDATTRSQRELANLLQRYWRPLYAHVRRSGASHHDAQDIVQGFFLSLLERRAVDRANPHRGRFRTFLLSSLKNYMANTHRRSESTKRGGGLEIIPLDESAGGFEKMSSMRELSPAAEFERLWALAVVDAALQRTRTAYERKKRGKVFNALQTCVTGESDAPRYQTLAGQLAMSVAAVKVEVSRIRRDFRASLRQEVACGLTDAREIDDEVRYLRQTLATT